MSNYLKPIERGFQRFDLNGIQEYILKKPESREGNVLMTMGGKREHATEVSLEDFEEMTGHYIVGLEPEYEYDLQELIQEYKELLVDNDFNLEENNSDYSLAGGNIRFATASNTHVTVVSYIAERGDQYAVVVTRDAGYQTGRKKEFEGPKSSLPLLLSNAEKTIEAYVSTKVQVLSKEISEEENSRKFDENGFAILKVNESVEDYFKSQEMDAGVVINAAGKYQAFYSYKTNEDKESLQFNDEKFKHGDHNFRCFHYDTKAYKTLKGAEKFLASKGYDLQGRNLDNVDVKQFAKAFREYNSRSYHSDMVSSWSDDVLSMFSLSKGYGTIEHLQKEETEKFGVKTALVFNYIDEKTGQQYQEKKYLSNNGDDFDYGGGTFAMTEFIKNIENNLYDDNCPDVTFLEDTRTNAEKAKFHKERAVGHQESVVFSKKYMDEAEGPYKEAQATYNELQDKLTSYTGDEAGRIELERDLRIQEHQLNRTKNSFEQWEKRYTKRSELVEHHKESYKALTQESESAMSM